MAGRVRNIGYIDYAHLKLNYAFIKDVNIICSFLKIKIHRTEHRHIVDSSHLGQRPTTVAQSTGQRHSPTGQRAANPGRHTPTTTSKQGTNKPPGPTESPTKPQHPPRVHPKPRRMNPPETSWHKQAHPPITKPENISFLIKGLNFSHNNSGIEVRAGEFKRLPRLNSIGWVWMRIINYW